ncbi:MAG TPA: class I SAM-dependent methyltransferase [Methylomirabilota bacterium]|nr:class I SAM-dependent methyltransferase [Methylomirabilota bacterium]
MTISHAALAECAGFAVGLQAALPPAMRSLFDGMFLRSWDLYDEFVYRLALRVFLDAGLDETVREPATTAEIVARAGFEEGRARIPLDWILHQLASRKVLEARGDRWARGPEPMVALDPEPIRAEQTELDATWLPAYVLAETVARDYGRFLRGEISGEDILFSPARFRMWIEYFSNANGLYAVNNRVGAIAVEEWLPRPDAVVLELGGGLASAACAVLERLERTDKLGRLGEYRFTELVPAFLRRGQQTLQARFPGLGALRFGALDMNRAFEAQGVAPGSVSVVYAVNTLHVASDLAFTLNEIARALEPGGRLIASECVRMLPGQALNAEFIFNLMGTFRSRRPDTPGQPPAGFLLPAEWTAVLAAAGFGNIRFLPDVTTFSTRFPRFHVAAIGAQRP